VTLLGSSLFLAECKAQFGVVLVRMIQSLWD
jgi:hypothetical protein